MILAIETATSRSSVALLDRDRVVAHVHADGATSHGEHIGALTQSLLREAGIKPAALTAIAVGTGPGPFTGLRVGLAFARMLAFARSVPLLGVGTLDVVAADADVAGEFLVATDARRKEIYWARYLNGVRLEGPIVARPAQVAERFPDLPIVGEGARTYAELFPNATGPHFPSAATLGRLALLRQESGEELSTIAQYLRAPDVTL